MKLHVIVAGTNIPSNAETLARAFMAGVSKKDPLATISWTFLRDLHLDHFSVDFYEPTKDQGSDYNTLRDAILSADGIVIASPIWNFSVPAHLKNMIDRIGSFGLDATHSVGTLKGKPFYLLFTGGAPDPGWNFTKRTVSHMPASIRYFGGSVIGQHYEGRCTKGRGVFGLVLDQRQDRLAVAAERGKYFAGIVEQYAKDGTLPVSQNLLTKLFAIGGKMKKAMGL